LKSVRSKGPKPTLSDPHLPPSQPEGLYQSVPTGDGSCTYLHPGHGASYRSTKGARTESEWVFLRGSGLSERPGPWRVLELGFGSGLNFDVCCQAARQARVELHYVALEPEPMPAALWLVEPRWRGATWNEPFRQDHVTLALRRQRWQESDAESAHFDAVFHDPFGPAVAADCWSASCFAWAARALREDGVLATYGASTAARQAMREAGLCVAILPGAPGKREMTIAAHHPEVVARGRLWKPRPDTSTPS
jgi:tRNA U34 5-methylaminomethyl-2-thiouridine-forming methyltransferase MnmC